MSVSADPPSSLPKSKKRKHDSPSKATSQQADENLDVTATQSSSKEALQQDDTAAVGNDDDEEEEVEAVSHAEARKRRKLLKKQEKSKAAKGNFDGDAGKVESGEDETAQAAVEAKPVPSGNQKRSQHGVWIGNMSFKTNEERIREHLKSCGTITRLHMPKGKGKFEYNRGFCYVDFESPDSVEDAIALSEGHLDGRRLLIKDSKSFEGRPAPPSNAAVVAGAKDGEVEAENVDGTSAGKPSVGVGYGLAEFGVMSLSKTAKKVLDRQRQPPAPTLFVGNLGFEVVKEDIQSMIEGHMETSKLWSKKDKTSSKAVSGSRGKGKLEDADEDVSDAAEEAEDEKADAKAESASDAEEEAEQAPSQKPSTSGIRKIRLGTFEDTGKCKGWAFVDFHSIGQATLALIDGRNHQLNGRALKLEYGSQDAVRRGGGRMGTGEKREKKVFDGPTKRDKSKYDGKKEKRKFAGDEEPAEETEVGFEEEGPRVVLSDTTYSGRAPLAANPYTAALITASAAGVDPVTGKAHKPNKAERMALRAQKAKAEKGGKRQKPGAALAAAQRQNVGIVRSEGKKITFDE